MMIRNALPGVLYIPSDFECRLAVTLKKGKPG